jgi:predicted DNA binding protein
MPRPSGQNPSSETARGSLRAARTPVRKPPPRLVTCRMRVALPPSTWLYSLTAAHPDCRVEVLDRLPLTGRLMLTEARIHGPGFRDVVSDAERLPAVEQAEILEEGPSDGRVRVTHRAPDFMALLRKLRMFRQFPFWVVNGTATWVVVDSDVKVRQLLAGLDRIVPHVRVEAIRPLTPESTRPLLTRREDELLRRAMAEGYFDVPRRVSLTALANRVSLAKSTLSRTLAVVEQKLLREVVGSLLSRGPGENRGEPVR